MKPPEAARRAIRVFRTAPFNITAMAGVVGLGAVPFVIEGYPPLSEGLIVSLGAFAIYEGIQVTRSYMKRREWLEGILEQRGTIPPIVLKLFSRYWCTRQIAVAAAEGYGEDVRRAVQQAFMDDAKRWFPFLPQL